MPHARACGFRRLRSCVPTVAIRIRLSAIRPHVDNVGIGESAALTVPAMTKRAGATGPEQVASPQVACWLLMSDATPPALLSPGLKNIANAGSPVSFAAPVVTTSTPPGLGGKPLLTNVKVAPETS